MSLVPLCPTPKELDKFSFKEFKSKFFKAVKKLAKKHNSPQTAAPFFLNLEQKYSDQASAFFMIFGKMAKWKGHAKERAVKEAAMRGACYVSYDEVAKSLTLHLMPVAGKVKSKEALVIKGLKKVVSPSRCSIQLVEGEFSEEMLNALEEATENMPETPDEEDNEELEEENPENQSQSKENAKTPEQSKDPNAEAERMMQQGFGLMKKQADAFQQAKTKDNFLALKKVFEQIQLMLPRLPKALQSLAQGHVLYKQVGQFMAQMEQQQPKPEEEEVKQPQASEEQKKTYVEASAKLRSLFEQLGIELSL